MRQVLGEADVADRAGQRRDDLGGLYPPHRIDCLLKIRHVPIVPSGSGRAAQCGGHAREHGGFDPLQGAGILALQSRHEIDGR